MFDVSVIVLAACASGLWLMIGRVGQSVAPTDLVIGVVALVLIALPIGGLSWIAVDGLALYILLFMHVDLPMRRDCADVLEPFAVPLFCKLHPGN